MKLRAFPGVLAGALAPILALSSAGGLAAAGHEEFGEIHAAGTRILFDRAAAGSARAVAADLPGFEAALAPLAALLAPGRPAAAAGLPSSVYLFGTERAFAPYAGGRRVAGWFVDRPDGHYVAAFGDAARAVPTVRHERVHAFLRVHLPGAPLWLDEGLADVLRTLAVRGTEAEIGAPVAGHLATLAGSWPLRTRDLLAVSRTTPAYSSTSGSGRFYATAWLAAHWLLTSDDGRAALGRYVALLARGVADPAAFTRAVGMDPASFDRLLLGHARRLAESDVTWRVALPAPPRREVRAGTVARPLAPAETHARLGLLLAHLGNDPAPAAKHLEAALRLDPRQPLAHFGRGILAWSRGDVDGASRAFCQAVIHDPRSAMARFFFGAMLLRQQRPSAARSQLLAAVALAPRHLPARALLALTSNVAGSRGVLSAERRR